MNNISKEELEEIITSAFKAGEDWGITHHTWFEPTKEQVEEKINKAKEAIFKEYRIV